MSFFISVHVGAGFMSSEEKYRKSLTESIKAGKESLKNGNSALDAVVKAIEILENDSITNCGKGSALNLNCEVQCDASLMHSKDLNWAGIGAVSNLKNPITAAQQLLLSQRKKHPDNLINPCFLVGKGAQKWAIEHGCLESNDLITDQAMDLFEKHRLEITKLKEDAVNLTINEQFKSIKKRKRDDSSSSTQDSIFIEHGYSEPLSNDKKVLDTVGAIAIDQYGYCASAVSSGGIMFKDAGRIGQAAVYGAGCWAEENVAVTTTGVGEYLMKTIFAQKCANKLLKKNRELNSDQFDSYKFDDLIRKTFVDKFLNSRFLASTDHDKLIGILSLLHHPENKKVQLIWSHNTPSMFLAYATIDCDLELIYSRIPNSIKDHVESRSLLINY